MQGQKAQAYLVTLWTYGLEPSFAEPARAALFCRILAGMRQRLGFLVHAYVVLPDRVRLILGARGGDLRWARMTVHRLKSRYAREVNARSGRLGLVWQDGEQTLPLCDAQDVRRKADYLHHNPVMAGPGPPAPGRGGVRDRALVRGRTARLPGGSARASPARARGGA